MPLIKLEIEGVRGFASRQTLDLAVPNGHVGSGLTVLVGPNGGGKSTVVEALGHMVGNQTPSFPEGRRNKRAGDRIDIVAYSSPTAYRRLRTVDRGGSETVTESAEMPSPFIYYVLPSRRTFRPFFGNVNPIPRDSYSSNYPVRTRGQILEEFSMRLSLLQRDAAKRSQFDEVLGRIVKPIPEWVIEQTDTSQYYLKVAAASDSYHSSEGLGEGIVSLLFIIDALYDSESGNVIVIDEPELSLHPALQRRLAGLLAEFAADRQVVIATHSPIFIDWRAIENGAGIARVHMRQGSSTISQLDRATGNAVVRQLYNTNNPHVLGLDAREVFFLDDRVVLVEGQEDVLGYRRILNQLELPLEADFYGWGVGGAGFMGVIARMLRELGFERVIGILDANATRERDELSRELPDYLFATIPANDVRSKAAVRERAAVEGLLDSNGRLRPQYETPLRELFAQINTALRIALPAREV